MPLPVPRPRRNRLNPFGGIDATPHRGTFLANRGDLHAEDGTVTRLWAKKRWLTCQLVSPTGHKVTFDQKGSYSPLFAADEAVALAAGHRPCWECRRDAYDRFLAAWRVSHDMVPDALLRAGDIDSELHASRIHRGRQVTHQSRLGDLPAGAFVTLPDKPDQPFLLWDNQLHPWHHAGYGPSKPAPTDAVVTVLTPAPSVAVLSAGYTPEVAVAGSPAPIPPSTRPRAVMEAPAGPLQLLLDFGRGMEGQARSREKRGA
jgi:hypothetical protein